MTGRILDPALLAELASVDTPTVCNAVVAVKARDDSEGFTGARVRCPTPELGVMAGHAVTATRDGRTPGQPRRRERSDGTFNVLEVGGPVTADRLRVAPGDLVQASANGVATAPLDIADRVYAQCRKVHERERAMREYVTGHPFPLEALRERALGRSSPTPARAPR